MKSRASKPTLTSVIRRAAMRSESAGRSFASRCPPAKRINVEDVNDFRRGRGDVIFSLFMTGLALFFLVFFFTQTGWDDRKLPDNMARYWMDQFGVTEPEGRLSRLGRILKQSWVTPLMCLMILVPAAVWNLRSALCAHSWLSLIHI